MTDPSALAEKFHEAYERLAPGFQYETRKESAVSWADVPKQNKMLMVAVCEEVMLPLIRDLTDRKPIDSEQIAELRKRSAENIKWFVGMRVPTSDMKDVVTLLTAHDAVLAKHDELATRNRELERRSKLRLDVILDQKEKIVAQAAQIAAYEKALRDAPDVPGWDEIQANPGCELTIEKYIEWHTRIQELLK